jgi:hypothetical protein
VRKLARARDAKNVVPPMGNPNRARSIVECLPARGRNNFLCRGQRFAFSHNLGQEPKLVDTISLGDAISSVAITPQCEHALGHQACSNKVAWGDIDGQKVSYGKTDLAVGV